MLLSEALSEYHFRERHERRVDATPDAVFGAIRSVTLAETPVARTLMRLRGLRAGAARPLLEEMDSEGFVQLAEEPLRELVYTAIGQPWKPLGGKRADAGNFGTFAEPGYAKMAFNFRFEDGILSTETRVWLTDERSRRSFRRYWLAIRPFSGLIRREWLRAIARRAEARTDGGSRSAGLGEGCGRELGRGFRLMRSLRHATHVLCPTVAVGCHVCPQRT